MDNWWRINKKKYATCDIEWNIKTGKVRARVNDGEKLTMWEEKEAYDARHAEFVGYQIVDKHRRKL